MVRKALNKITRRRRYPEIELAIIERLENASGELRFSCLFLGLSYDIRNIFAALKRLEAVGVIRQDKKTVALVHH